MTATTSNFHSHISRSDANQLTCVHAFVRIETGLLGKSLETKVALEWPFASVSAHVHFQVRFPTESCIANLYE